MDSSNMATSMMNINYNELICMIEEQKRINVDIVERVICQIINQSKKDGFDPFDDNEKADKGLIPHMKMSKLAEYFADNSIQCEGDTDTFHNIAVSYARQKMYYEACLILERGITDRGNIVDLLADYIRYGICLPRNREKCRKYYESLLKIPHKRWNWRAYSFSIDHLLEERYHVTTTEEENTLKDQVISIGKEFIQRFSSKYSDGKTIDRAYMDLATIYKEFGDYENEIKTLHKCADKYIRSPLTSLRLAEKNFHAGRYSEATRYLSQCVACFEIQPSVGNGTAYLLRAYNTASIVFTDEICDSETKLSYEQREKMLDEVRNDLDIAEALMEDDTFEGAIMSLRHVLDKQYKEEF